MRLRRALLLTIVATGCGLDVVGVGAESGQVVGEVDGGGIARLPDGAAAPDGTRPAEPTPADEGSGDATLPVDAGECTNKCPAGTARTLCVAGKCTDAWRVFVTAARYPPQFPDFAASDAKCDAAAKAAGLGGTWKAWLSRSQQSPIDRFAKAPVPYRLLDGTVVGVTEDIFPPSAAGKSTVIVHAINRTENNVPITAVGELEVWTGTNRYGYSGERCKEWAPFQAADTGIVGLLDKSTYEWTSSTPRPCLNATAHLYCFEQ